MDAYGRRRPAAGRPRRAPHLARHRHPRRAYQAPHPAWNERRLMRTAHVAAAALLLAAAVLVGWNVGGALLGLGALMTLGYRHGRIPRDAPRPGDPAWEEA